MRRHAALPIAVFSLVLSWPKAARGQTFPAGVRLLCGVTDNESAKWDGSATARGARLAGIEQWRFEGDDAISGNSWKMSTRNPRMFGGARLFPQAQHPVANGVILRLEGASESSEVQVRTAQGAFSVKLSDIPYGKMYSALGGRVKVDRVPPVTRITSSPEEQDYPAAAAGKDGSVWLAYMEFKHNKNHDQLRANFRTPPPDFGNLKAPPGGDQIFVRKHGNGRWEPPIAVSEPGGDLYRPAVAVDGAGRPWVFWSANQNGNFDLWARSIEGGRAGRTVRVTSEPGSDVFPVATTDSSGKVWVAWQGWRNGRAAIFAATQQDNGFSAPAMVSTGGGNEWNPTVAADGAGHVTAAWDSYRNGNYDVFLRTATGPGAWGKETAVAATAKYEAYPSLAYDASGRLWVAYEEGGERWGKDFGAYETSGLALYQGRAVRVRGYDAGGRAITTKADISMAMPGVPSLKADSTATQGDSSEWLKPSLKYAANRDLNRAQANVQATKNTSPRLMFDPSGRLWVSFRSAHPVRWSVIGTVWSEYVVSFDGNSWTGPIYLTHSDNLLDNRPALIAGRPGELMVISPADGRANFQAGESSPAPGGNVAANTVAVDPYNNDLYANTIALPPASGPVAAVPAPALAAAKAEPDNVVETKAVKGLRDFRTKDNLRIIRGEFHRHSEVSMDGGNDGTVLDQWRYMLDAAAMDWIGCCDHDNGGGREYSWWIEQKLTDMFYTPGRFVPMFSYERSVSYPEGHRNVIFARRGVRTLPRLPITTEDTPGHAPDTQMLYRYLKQYDGIVAMHSSGTGMGTDWRDNDPVVEPVVEIYQGERQNYEMPGAPRTNTENDSIGGWKPKGFVNLALEMGYKLSFQASSDHISTHMSYCNIFAPAATREGLLDGFKKRHVYGATDNILADFRSGEHMMGDAFSTAAMPDLRVKLAGTAPFAKVSVVKDNKYVYSVSPDSTSVDFSWKDTHPQAGKTSYYYVRGEQKDGEIVWVSPMWITYTGK